MPKVTLAAGAADLGADHAVARVPHEGDVSPVNRIEEARPPGTGLELRARAEQRQPTQPAHVGAGCFGLVEHAAERGFGAVLQDDRPFLLGQVSGEDLLLLTRWPT